MISHIIDDTDYIKTRRNGGKGSFEVRKLGRWKRGEKFQMTNEVPNSKNTDYTDNKKTRRHGDKENGRNGRKGSFEVRKLGR